MKIEANMERMDKMLRATADLHTNSDITTHESMWVLINLACIIAHETCESKERLMQLLDQSYDHIGSGAEHYPVQ